jgi:hypothetical protein
LEIHIVTGRGENEPKIERANLINPHLCREFRKKVPDAPPIIQKNEKSMRKSKFQPFLKNFPLQTLDKNPITAI